MGAAARAAPISERMSVASPARRFATAIEGQAPAMPEPLPEDLSVLDARDLTRARVERDDRLTTLFRRWPRLTRLETRELKATYAERLRLARHFGRRRNRERSAASPGPASSG